MSWVPIAVAGWLAVALALALVIGAGIRMADRRGSRSLPASRVVDGLRAAPAGTRRPLVRDCIPPAERLPSAGSVERH